MFFFPSIIRAPPLASRVFFPCLRFVGFRQVLFIWAPSLAFRLLFFFFFSLVFGRVSVSVARVSSTLCMRPIELFHYWSGIVTLHLPLLKPLPSPQLSTSLSIHLDGSSCVKREARAKARESERARRRSAVKNFHSAAEMKNLWSEKLYSLKRVARSALKNFQNLWPHHTSLVCHFFWAKVIRFVDYMNTLKVIRKNLQWLWLLITLHRPIRSVGMEDVYELLVIT